MSVLIKGMEMPESCLDCKVHYVWGSGRPQCLITGEFIDDCNAYEQKRFEDCPLVPVPPHGRLIDAYAEIGVNVTMMPGGKCRVDLIAPTVIPAEEGE